MDELFPIPKKLVDILPFQAIALSFDHVQPTSTGSEGKQIWSDKVFDSLVDVVIPVESESTFVDVVATSKANDEGYWHPVSNHYRAIIFKGGEEIGEILVEKDLAVFKDGGNGRLEKVKSSMLKQMNNDLNLNDDSDDEYSSGDFDGECQTDNDFDVYVGEEKNEFLQNIFGDYPLKKTNSSGNNNSLLPLPSPLSTINNVSTCASDSMVKPIIPSTFQLQFPGIKTPTVEWYQTNETVMIRILVPDIKKYEVKIEDKKQLTFRTIEPPNYGFQLILSMKVEVTPEITPLGQYTKMKLRKRMTGLPWEALYQGQKTMKATEITPNSQEENDDSSILPSLLSSRKNKLTSQPLQTRYDESGGESETSDTECESEMEECMG